MIQHSSLYKKLIALVVIALLFPSCSTNPATGKSVLTGLMSPESARKIGRQEHQKIIQQFGVVRNQKVTNFANNIMRRLEKHSERKDVTYRMTVLDTDMINAFAVPGGYLYVTRGLLGIANSEDEVAAVIAHEMGHITAQHSAQQYSQGRLLELGGLILGAATGSQSMTDAASIGSNLYLKGYSRHHEYEADDLGIRYLTYEGYNPKAMAIFLKNLERHKKWEAEKSKNKGSIPEYLSTHPSTPKRVERATSIAEEKGYANQNETSSGRSTYMTMIDGVDIGESSVKGVMRGQRYAHASRDMTMVFPEGFTVDIRPMSVLVTQGTKGMLQSSKKITFKTISTSDSLEKYFANHNWDDFNITQKNGFERAEGVTHLLNRTTAIIALKDGNTIYRFFLEAKNANREKTFNTLRSIADSFRRLKENEKTLYRAHTIRTFQAKQGNTLIAVATELPKPYTNDVELLRVLNGLDASEDFKAGVTYKTIR